MKKLIMLSVFALGVFNANASNDFGKLLKNEFPSQLNNQFEFGCYRISATTAYFQNYGLIYSTDLTNYKIFTSISELNAYIQTLKAANPDSIYNGTGYVTTYTYSKVSSTNCVTIN